MCRMSIETEPGAVRTCRGVGKLEEEFAECLAHFEIQCAGINHEVSKSEDRVAENITLTFMSRQNN